MKSAASLALGLIFAAVLAGLLPVALIGAGDLEGRGLGLIDPYFWQIIHFTVLQAALSTALSILLAIPVARALAANTFPGRGLIIQLFALPLALPAIVAILGLVAIFGKNGIVPIDLYGLTGILIAHVFFNMPLAVRLLLQRLENIPVESLRLADQLGLTGWDKLRLIDWPAMRDVLPGIASLIFLLCAASFAVVLTLGGGPQATTLEVGIYQSLRFDFDPARATALAVAQLILCFTIVAVSWRASGAVSMWPSQAVRLPERREQDWLAIGICVALAIFTALPIVAVALSGALSDFNWIAIRPALLTSIAVALASGTVCVTLAWPLAVAAYSADGRLARFLFGAAPCLALVIPPAVLATGWFLFLRNVAPAPVLVIAMNALMALPFALSALASAVRDNGLRHDRLSTSMAIHGWNRIRLVDLPTLRRPLAQAFLLSMLVSMGDLTAISLFGSQDFSTLPALIYSQMGSYRVNAAAGTALILMILCTTLIVVATRLGRNHDQA